MTYISNSTSTICHYPKSAFLKHWHTTSKAKKQKIPEVISLTLFRKVKIACKLNINWITIYKYLIFSLNKQPQTDKCLFPEVLTTLKSLLQVSNLQIIDTTNNDYELIIKESLNNPKWRPNLDGNNGFELSLH